MYSKIDCRLWDDEKILSLSSDATYMFVYLLSTKHRNVLGCYQLPLAYAQSDTKLPEKRFKAAWKELMGSGMIQYDEKNRIVLVKNFLKYNPIENPKQAQGAVSKLVGMPRTLLLCEVQKLLSSLKDKPYLQPLIKALADFITEPSAKPFEEPLPEPFEEPFPEPYGKPVNSKQITDNSRRNDLW